MFSLWGSQEPLTGERAEVSVRIELNTGEYSEGQWWEEEVELAMGAMCPVTHQMCIEHSLGGKQALKMQDIYN